MNNNDSSSEVIDEIIHLLDTPPDYSELAQIEQIIYLLNAPID